MEAKCRRVKRITLIPLTSQTNLAQTRADFIFATAL